MPNKRKKYKLVQYPKNKDIPTRNLSIDQLWVRDRINAVQEDHQTEKRRCNECRKELPVGEFYLKNRETGRLDRTCRDCRMKKAGILNIGKYRFSATLLDKKFRRCSICKQILPLMEFNPSTTSAGGYSHTCKECNVHLTRNYRQRQMMESGHFHLRQYGLRKGITEFTDEVYEKLREEIDAKRETRFVIDGHGFVTVTDFAEFMLETYKIPVTTTSKRISEGYTVEQCKLSEKEARSIAKTKGSILVTDTVTGKTFRFRNTHDPELNNMFSTSAIARCIKTGEATRVTNLSKYPNPCTIKRVSKDENEI